MGLSNTVNWLLSLIGWSEEWHISWRVNKYNRQAVADGSYTVSPRMSAAAINGLREKLAKDSDCDSADIYIVSMAKINK